MTKKELIVEARKTFSWAESHTDDSLIELLTDTRYSGWSGESFDWNDGQRLYEITEEKDGEFVTVGYEIK